MAEINNSLALGIKNDPVDIGKILQQAASINSLRASTAQTEQETQYRQFQQDQGQGYRVPDLNTLAETHQKQMDIGGRIGSILEKDQSLAARKQAIQLSHQAGRPVDPAMEQHLLTAPASQVKQYGLNMQRGGQSAASNQETSGDVTRNQGQYLPQGIPPNEPIISRTEAATGGRKEPSQYAVDRAIRDRRNFDGSPRVLSTSDIVGTPKVVRNPDGSISSNVTPETTATQTSLAQDYAGYRENAKNAATTKYVLKNMADDADRLATGKGATFTNNVKQWIQSAQTLPAVGGVVKSITGDISDPIAAFEALQKNAGQLTRATLKDVDGKAASEYQMIQRQLPNAEMSPRGLKLVTAQMIAPEDFKQAKLQAADNWKKQNNGSLAGFEGEWNKNISPSTFLFARLPSEDRNVLIKNLSKTKDGQAQLETIKRQAAWAHHNGLDEFID